MRNQRSFSLEFKRQVIEELLSGDSGPAQRSTSPIILSAAKNLPESLNLTFIGLLG